MKNLSLPIASIILLMSTSFDAGLADRYNWIGIFGSCQNETTLASGIQLSIRDDQTFNYIDNTQRDKINVTGHWQLKGSAIVLIDFPQTIEIPTHWDMAKGENCVKTRKGLTWIRLCRTNLK
jgi:hypothetical protein